MKKILFSLALLLTLGSTAPVSAQHHRHTPRTTTVANQPSASPQASAQATPQPADDGIEAYSDTTSLDTASTAAATDADDADDIYNPGRYNDPFSWLVAMFSSGVGSMIATLIILLMLLFFLMPLIILILIIRYFVRRHNDRVRLAEMAMQHGYPLTDEQMPLSRKSPDYMWRRGVRNVSMGVGFVLFFWFLGAEPLMGIGGLMACLGLGQMFMVRYNYNSRFGRKQKDSDATAGDATSSDATTGDATASDNNDCAQQ